MIIDKIKLSDFRNIESKTFEFSPRTTVIIGPNTSGKTNILEAINLLSTGKSFRARVEEEMINYDEEIARVKGLVKSNDDKTVLEVVLTRGEITVGEDPAKKEKAPKKKLLVNDVSRRLYKFAGNLKTVLFGPWDLDIVTESPSVRRDFLDSVLSQVDREYGRANLSYEKGLRQRNKLLYRIREEGLSRKQLIFWDKLLIKNGNYMSEKRADFIEYANETEPLDDAVYRLEYDKSAISESRLDEYAKEEVEAATTLVGPHRDDVIFRIKDSKGKKGKKQGREVARYGSRGEQRMGVLWLKLAELKYIKEEVDETPTLLLDDIFSELDHQHRKVVMKFVKNSNQVIITTADPHFIEGTKVEKIHIKG
jgi:DNA replication and repair protein RecF